MRVQKSRIPEIEAELQKIRKRLGQLMTANSLMRRDVDRAQIAAVLKRDLGVDVFIRVNPCLPILFSIISAAISWVRTKRSQRCHASLSD